MRSSIIPFIFLWIVSNGQRNELPQLEPPFQGQSAIESSQLNLPLRSGIFLITALPALSAKPEVTDRIATIFPTLSTSSDRRNFQLSGSPISNDRGISQFQISPISSNRLIYRPPIANEGQKSDGQYFNPPLPTLSPLSAVTDRTATIFPTLPSSGRRQFQVSASPILSDRGIFPLPQSPITTDRKISHLSNSPFSADGEKSGLPFAPISTNGDRLTASQISTDKKTSLLSNSPFSADGERPGLPFSPISTNGDRLTASQISTDKKTSHLSNSPFSADGERPGLPFSPISTNGDRLTGSPISTDRKIYRLSGSPFSANGEKSGLPFSPISTNEDRQPVSQISNDIDVRTSDDRISNEVQPTNSSTVDVSIIPKVLKDFKPNPSGPSVLKIGGPGKIPLKVKVTRTDQLGEDEWTNFKRTYNKAYDSDQEDRFRREIFMENKVKISNYNDIYSRGLSGYFHRMNTYGDLLHNEFVKTLNGFDADGILDNKRNPKGSTYLESLNVVLPPNIDWRLGGAVTPPKNQGKCLSCYAFAVAGALEAHNFRKFGVLRNVSAQQIIDCSSNYTNHGCKGGKLTQSYIFVRDAGIANTADGYSYEEKEAKCRQKKDDHGGICTGYVSLGRYNEKEMEVAVATIGPITAAIDANQPTMQFLSDGVYDDPECRKQPNELNHAVLIIGYGQESNGKKYWLVKNSYGDTWGAGGYFKIARGFNQCGISVETSFPLV